MNTQEYIDSGVLELYAAGGLTPAENADVERMAAQNPEVRAALEECLRTMEAYALTYAKAPRPELEDVILRQLHQNSPVQEQNPAAENTAKVIPFGTAPAVSTDYEGKSDTKWWQMAAVVLLLISAAANVYLYSNLQETKSELVSAQQSSRQFALQVNQMEQRSLLSENLLGVLRNPQTLAVELKGVTQHPDAQARVFWNQESKEVYFDPAGLPAAPAGKQYQLWALAKGKPVDAGVVKSADSALVKMKPVDEAQAFAVTLEPEGGSVNPTLDEMYVMGANSGR